MRKKQKDRRNALMLVNVMLGILCLLMLAGCQKEVASAETYTCPMHPTVVSHQHGVCPVCGMDLVRKARPGEAVKVTEDLQALLASPASAVVSQVKTLRVDFKSATASLKISGVVTYDPRAAHVVSARAAGRLEQVYVTTPLQRVQKGEKMAVLYSPELATASRELIYLATHDAQNTTLIQSARRKLELLGLTPLQIDDVVRRQETTGTYALYSPYDGYAVVPAPADATPAMTTSTTGMNNVPSANVKAAPSSDVLLREGDYVSAEQTLLTLAGTEALRVELDLPGSYARQIHAGDDLGLGMDGGITPAKVDFVQPFFTSGENLLKVRVTLRNSGTLAIGQLVEATIQLKGDESYWIPRAAVTDLGLHTVVFVKQQGVFKPKQIEVGSTVGGWVQIRSGLTSQDEIAAQAGYLIDSESLIWSYHTDPVGHQNTVAAPAPQESVTLMLNDTQAQLANITTQKATTSAIGPSIVTNGRLVTNQQRSEVISSRAAGRIEKLYIKETGRRVRQGEPLYELYSETLLTLQQEYLMAKAQEGINPRFTTLAAAAEKKLLRYGMIPAQITNLAKQNTAGAHITFVAPASGVVTETGVTEGEYVNEGALLYRMDDISTLWVEGDLYSTEASQIKKGDALSIQIDGAAEPITSQVIFIAPQYRNGSQVTIVRAALKNDDGFFTPGMQARLTFTTPGPKTLTVPLNAVIRHAEGAHVYVQTAPHTYRPRRVTTGAEDFARIAITSGLAEGDVIVSTGAYLLYSEIVLKKGTSPIAAHNH